MEIANPTKRYDSSHSLVYSCQDHVVFCPKFRRPIRVGEIEERLKELLLAGQQRDEYEWLEWEVMPDHVHLLLSVSPQVGVGPVVGRIKGWTAHVLRSEFPALKSRLPSLWTRSKFISTVGAVTLEVVKRYIEEQKGR